MNLNSIDKFRLWVQEIEKKFYEDDKYSIFVSGGVKLVFDFIYKELNKEEKNLISKKNKYNKTIKE